MLDPFDQSPTQVGQICLHTTHKNFPYVEKKIVFYWISFMHASQVMDGVNMQNCWIQMNSLADFSICIMGVLQVNLQREYNATMWNYSIN